MHVRTASKKNKNRASLSPRLAAYSVTAGAAMACAPNGQAAVQNITLSSFSVISGPSAVPPSLTFTTANYQQFNAGPFNLKFMGSLFYRVATSTTRATFGSARLSNDGGLAQFKVQLGQLALLNAGDAVTGGSFQINANAAFASIGGNDAGNFLPAANGAVTGYIALKNDVLGTDDVYGWLRVQVRANANGYPVSIKLVESQANPGVFGAYNTKSSIAADDFKIGTVNPIPEPSVVALSGLGLLALGAAGVREMRRRRSAAAESLAR